MTNDISASFQKLTTQIREALDPLGFVNAANGAFKTGHVPHVAPLAYLASFYAGLDDNGIQAAEAECDRFIPVPYRALLRHKNGLRLGKLSLHGTTFLSAYTSGPGIGQPISLVYQNVHERPDYIPNGHLGIGAMNGAWHSQGHLYHASTGEVEMYHRDANLLGARWASFEEFLESEIPRQLSLYDADGRIKPDVKQLPGDTETWEEIAKAKKSEQARASGLRGKIAGMFRRWVSSRETKPEYFHNRICSAKNLSGHGDGVAARVSSVPFPRSCTPGLSIGRLKAPPCLPPDRRHPWPGRRTKLKSKAGTNGTRCAM